MRAVARARVLLLFAGALLGAVAASGTATAQATLGRLLENGPKDQRINIVVLSEGYTATQLGAFEGDAARIVDALLDTPPYDAYRAYFNAFTLAVPSVESGSDHPSRSEFRDTYFGTYYDCSGITRLICVDGEGMQRVQNLLQAYLPEYDVVLLVVNDPEYGGSGGSISVTSVDPSAAEIAIHEVGHSFVALADEYGGGEIAGYEQSNVTQETRRDHVRWRHWIDAGTPVPTPPEPPFLDVVGLFEGAAYNDFGWYRPQFQCKMRSLGVSFCAVCSEHHVRAIYQLVGPVAAAEPAPGLVTLPADGSATFRVASMAALHRLDVQWFVDGMPVAGATEPTFTLAGADVPATGAVLSARVADGTDLVRDPAIRSLLEEAVAWTVVGAGDTAAEGEEPGAGFTLGANYPNPVRTSTTFAFRLSERSFASLEVYDVTGRTVATVVSDVLPAGVHDVHWTPPPLAPGIYFYRLQTPHRHATRRLVLLP